MPANLLETTKHARTRDIHHQDEDRECQKEHNMSDGDEEEEHGQIEDECSLQPK